MIQVAGKQMAWREGMTVSDLLEELKDPHPYAVVRINEQYVTRAQFRACIRSLMMRRSF